MRKILKKVVDLTLGLLMLPMVTVMSLHAQQSFSTTIYLDYRYFLSTEGPVTLKPASDTTAYLSNQFVFRRAYLNYENKISDNLKFRFRFDADNSANVTGVSLTGDPVTGASLSKDDKLRPFIKHLFLQYDNFLVPKMTLNVGMIETLTFKPAEDRWGLRSVAKTLLDGYKDITKKDIHAPSADIGASLKYSLAKYVKLAAGYYNGRGYSHLENDQYKEIQLQTSITPIAGLSFVGYMDYERLVPVASLPAETSPKGQTYKVDAFVEMVKNLMLGGEWFTYQNDFNQTDGVKYDVRGWSAFGRYVITDSKLQLFARYDSYEPNCNDKGLSMSLIIVGFDWAPYHKSWKLQPNIWFANYTDGTRYNAGATKNSDVVFNLTFFLTF